MPIDNVHLYVWLIFCCLHENDTVAAFQYAANAKGRAFVDMLASTRFDLAAAAADDPALPQTSNAPARSAPRLTLFWRVLLVSIRMSMGIGNSAPLSDDLRKMFRQELSSLYDEYKVHWDMMAHKYLALTATQRAPDLSAQDAQTLAGALYATLVEYYQHEGEWVSFSSRQRSVVGDVGSGGVAASVSACGRAQSRDGALCH